MTDLVLQVLPFAVPIGATFGALLVCFHLWKMYGSWKPAVEMVVSGVLLAYILEEIGVHTGIVFGHYYFNPPMGFKVDVIPFGLPFGWLCLIYMAWITTNLILYGKPLPNAFKHGDILMTSALGTLVLTTLDLNADPIMSGLGCWDWPDGGPFFGVPIHNYMGWLFVGFVTLFMHGYLLRARKDLTPLEDKSKLVRLSSYIPVLVFGFASIAFMIMNYGGIMGLLSLFLYGIPFVAATWRWCVWYKENK